MTWDELKKKAREMGATFPNDYELVFNGVVFSCTGCVSIYCFNHPVIVRERTPEQMLAIMEALK
jgi:hypothetical protein